jgi:hypothetical protein
LVSGTTGFFFKEWDSTLQEKNKKIGSVEIIVFHNVLGDVCRSRREGQTEEDVPMDIFDMRL